MSTLGSILGNAAAPHTFEHKGKTYTLRLLDQNAKTVWEKFLFDKSRKALLAWKDDLSEEEFATQLEALNAAYVEGKFDITDELSRKALKTPGGCLQMACILFDAPSDVIFELALERPAELKATIKMLLMESLPAIARKLEEADPNGQGGAGSPPNATGST